MPKVLPRRPAATPGIAPFGVADARRLTAAQWHTTGVHLLNQQLWCWGQDVLFARGNLLVRYGFQRTARAADQHGSSIYRLQFRGGQRVVLRGFGVFIGDDRRGGMLLKRYEFSPWITPHADLRTLAWQIDDLPRMNRPACDQHLTVCRQLLSTLIDWICDYERWVRQAAGAPYRRQVIAAWKALRKGRVTPSHMMSRTWRSLQSSLVGPVTQAYPD
ncbi:MAG: hypothetical protein JNL18_02580 [Planctomycetaceae bacterium]|nr:hypothetical protein [Planctomycetaceae bacterium]